MIMNHAISSWKRSGLFLYSLFAGFILLSGSTCTAIASEHSVEAILKSWTAKPTSFKSFEYRCELIQEQSRTKLKGDDPGNGFAQEIVDDSQHSATVSLKKDLVVAWQNKSNKRLITFRGEFWDTDSRSVTKQDSIFAFDGEREFLIAHNRRFPFALGTIQQTTARPTSMSGEAQALPILMWCDFIGYLKRRKFDLDTMSIIPHEYPVLSEGKECIDLSISDARGLFTGRMLVQDSPPFELEQFILELRGNPMYLLQINYVSTDRGASVSKRVKSWTQQQYNVDPNLDWSIKGTVRNFLIDTEFEQKKFSDVVPVGAHMAEETKAGFKYWLQKTKSKRKPISPEEYRGLPKEVNRSEQAL